MSKPVVLTLIAKPGCHLCTDAEAVIAQVLEDLRDAHPTIDVSIENRNILEDRELALRYSDEIPVVLINGAQHCYWHVLPDKLSAAILKEAQL